MTSPAPVPIPQPRFPLEIQLAIVEMCLDARTRLRLVSTHKALRYRGARLALQLPPSAPVQLHSEPAAQSFIAFCVAQGPPMEPSSPLALLHALDINIASVDPADMWPLAYVPRLTSLTLRDAEKGLHWDSEGLLYAALQRLRTLKTLEVLMAGTMTFKLVSEIASALEAVRIEPRHHTAGTTLNLNVVLGPHKDTLTRVGLICVNLLEGVTAALRDVVVFEKVQELVIPLCIHPGAPRFIKAFPNAVSLHVGINLTNGFPKRIKVLDNIRTWNVETVLRMHSGSLGLKANCWPSLERVRGGLVDLYTFGNSCSVEVLQIDGLIKYDWGCLARVVQLHYPAILHMSVSPSSLVSVWEAEWRRMSSVRYLVLQFVVEDLVDLESLTNIAIRAVGSFVHCKTVFLDFTAKNDPAHRLLLGLDHLSLRRIVEDRQLGPFEIVVRSPVETTYWCHRPDAKRQWEVRHMPAKTNFQMMDCFPKDYVTDDWL